MAHQVKNPRSIHEHAGSIHGPGKWVKDPVLPQLWLRPQLHLGCDPWLGNSICCGAGKEGMEGGREGKKERVLKERRKKEYKSAPGFLVLL